ncbi:fibronectin type III domain-containing protein [Mahella australiensis]|uniref:Fibronectin type III domain protein n=1 Tax=Mahella australiensis (strain DSM 15567 / CIP 107919 / 50-1 BON) TaxID=697281 RepID=F4A0T8_MAHA5|nr:fibronectin type III domain-containing protein [Mahella australiensis]AEE96984.1 Fibronectin type III domain protein [Mahella australiensis 50-1 BON]
MSINLKLKQGLCAKVMVFVMLICMCMPITPQDAFAQGGGVVEDFNDNTLTGWWSDANYKLTEANGELKIEANKANNSWASFTYSFESIDISQKPYVSIKVRSDFDFRLSFSVWDSADHYAYSDVTNEYEVVSSKYFKIYTFNFSNVKDVDLTKIKKLNFVFNPDNPSCSGTAFFDDLKIGADALLVPNVTSISNQQTYINAPEQTVNVWGIKNAIDPNAAVELTASSSNTSLIPTPTIISNGDGTAVLKYKPTSDKIGSSTIKITATSSKCTDVEEVLFDVSVEGNNPPQIISIPDQIVKKGEYAGVDLKGIDDGNPNARQNIDISATVSNAEAIKDLSVNYTSDDRYGSLRFLPEAVGNYTITLTLKDNGGTIAEGKDTFQTTFNVSIYEEVNKAPQMGNIKDVAVLQDCGEQTVSLTGIDDGDDGVIQNLSFQAVSSNPTVVPNPSVEYMQGNAYAVLEFKPTAGQIGETNITLKLSDDGGRSNNNGDAFTEKTFKITVRAKPITGFEDDFNDGVTDPRWLNSGEGCHFCSEENGALNIYIDKTITNNVWAGLWFSIPEELDLSQYPYISIRMKTDKPGTKMLVFLWDAYDHYNTAGTVQQVVTDEYVEYYFDFTGKDLQGDGQKVDFSRIKALLFNFAPGEMFTGTFYFDDLRVGSKAHRPLTVPACTIDPVADYALKINSDAIDVNLTGISDGIGHNDNVSLKATSADTNLIPDPQISEIVGGKASLRLIPCRGVTGSTTITLTVSASGSDSKSISFKVDVLDVSGPDSVNVDINTSETYQKIDGFGAFLGAGKIDREKIDLMIPWVNDIGLTVARFGGGGHFEWINDNSNPAITDYGSFNLDDLSLELMRELKDKSSIDKFVLTVWSPPYWMKRNKSMVANSWATNNVLEPRYYREYAEELVGMIKTIKAETGIDLYAISLQNEPEFNEPYDSAVLLWNEYKELIKVVGPLFEQEGIKTKIFMPEVLPAQGHVYDYINSIASDPQAGKYVDIIAIHNYDEDGIHVGGAGAKTWSDIYNWAQMGKQRVTWMSETSGHINNIDGAMTLAGNIYNAIRYGNISSWIWWSFMDSGDGSTGAYGLILNNKPSLLYGVSKQFYKFIKPGAMRVEAISSNDNILTLAFKDDHSNKLSVVVINKDSVSHSVKIDGDNLPAGFMSYMTSNHRICTRMEDITRDLVVPPNSVTTLYGDYTNSDYKAPSVPTGLKVTEKTDTTITLSWQPSIDNTGIKSYDIYVGDIKMNTSDITNTTFKITGLSPNTQYKLSVAARDAAGNISARSEFITAFTTNASNGEDDEARDKLLKSLGFFVGKVTRSFSDTESNIESVDLSRYIDTKGKTITSMTGELLWDYDNGIMKIDTPNTQGATGFLNKVKAIDLGDIVIESGNDYATIVAVSLDNKPLKSSKRIMIQAMTEDKFYGAETVNGKITSLGSIPLNVKNINAKVTFKGKSQIHRVITLDENGYEKSELKVKKDMSGTTITLASDAIFTVALDTGHSKDKKPYSATGNYIWWEGESPIETNYPEHSDFDISTEGEWELLSGDNWLTSDGERAAGQDPYFAKYQLEVPADGEYNFWVRKFWKHGPFRWRFDNQEWNYVGSDVSLADNVDLRTFICANWVNIGKVNLTAGTHVFEFELTAAEGESTVSGFDCFMLTPDLFVPRGELKPGEKTGNHEEGYFAFEPDIDPFKEAWMDLRNLNEAVAGQSGYVKRDGDGFVLGDGTPVRFWAVNATMYQDHETIDYMARRLAKYGVNMVRVHGALFDEDNVDLSVIDKEKLDKLHYFVSAMKKEGIYTNISFYFPLWINVRPEYGLEGYETISNKHPFALLQFDPEFQKIYKNWARTIFKTVNPYTGVSLAEDPAVAIIEIQNEDSYFFWTFGRNNIPEIQINKLETRFATWLIKKYGSLDAALAAWGDGSAQPLDNIAEGRMELKDAWFMTKDGCGTGAFKNRMSDQVRFLTEMQKGFYNNMVSFFKNEIGTQSMISCSNWTTADPVTLDALERYTYTEGDVIDRHGYFECDHKGEAASYSVRVGDTYKDISVMTNPASCITQIVQVAGYPHMITETAWTNPNKYHGESVPMWACYGALQGMDAIHLFAVNTADWETSVQKWPVMVPSVLGQFPAFALMYRRGDLQEAPEVLKVTHSMEELYNFQGSPIYENQALDLLRQPEVSGESPVVEMRDKPEVKNR